MSAKPAEYGEEVYLVDGDTAYPARVRAVDGENRVMVRYEAEGEDGEPAGFHRRGVPEKGKAGRGEAYWTRQKPKEAEVIEVPEPEAAPPPAEG
jgi:hypothetical protein